MANCYWSLFNQRDRTRFDGLRTAQAQAIVQSIPLDEMNLWLAWKEGTPEWLELRHHVELFEKSGTAAVESEADDLSEMTASNASFATESTVSPHPLLISDSPEVDTATDIAIGSLGTADDENHGPARIPARLPPLSKPSASQEDSGVSEESAFNVLDAEAEEFDADIPTRPAQKPGLFPKPTGKPKAVGSKEKAAGQGAGSGSERLPSANNVFEIDDGGLEVFNPEIDDVRRADKRKSSRYRARLNLVVDWGGPTPFKTRTADISIGGIRLESPLPPDARRHVKITLSRGRDSLQGLCETLVGKDGKITRLKILSVNRMDLLRSWLLAPNG